MSLVDQAARALDELSRRERWTSDDDLAFAGELLTRACSDDPAGAEELLEVAIEHATYTQYLRLLDELLGRERR